MEDKEFGSKWNFLNRRKASHGQSREDASFAPFVQNKIRCLVREYIQNSMDVHSKKHPDGPVEVVFSYGTLECASYPNLIQSLKERLIACSEHCQKFDNSKNPYENKIEYLNEHLSGSIGYLKVSDYNTTGMSYNEDEDAPSEFQACVRESSASFKHDENAGGSHGQGKTVGFVNSGINAVFYSTMDEDGNTYGEGIVKLCDHKLVDENGVPTRYEANAYYDCHNGEQPNVGDEIPTVFRRNVPGTDAFVLGMEKEDDDVYMMKKEILRSFFKAIYEEKLIVTVDGDPINKANLEDNLLAFFEEDGEFDSIRTNTPWLKFNPRPYLFECLKKAGTDESHLVFSIEEDFPGQFPLLGKAKLYMWKDASIKEANLRDSIVYMRDNSMAVEVKRTSSPKGYYAVFECDGVGSSKLRKTENVTHDKWDVAELRDVNKDEKLIIKKTIESIKLFIAEVENLVFPEQTDQEKIIASLKRHRLGSSSNRTSDSEEDAIWPTTNIANKAKDSKSGESPITILETKKREKEEEKKPRFGVRTNTASTSWRRTQSRRRA